MDAQCGYMHSRSLHNQAELLMSELDTTLRTKMVAINLDDNQTQQRNICVYVAAYKNNITTLTI